MYSGSALGLGKVSTEGEIAKFQPAVYKPLGMHGLECNGHWNRDSLTELKKCLHNTVRHMV